MKISNVSKLVLSLGLALSTLSFSYAKEEGTEKKEAKAAMAFDASLYKVANTNKVKLAIDKIPDANVTILLRDNHGKVIYHEVLRKNSEDLYRRVFDLEGVEDGAYYFVMMGKNTKITKKVEISSSSTKVILL
ncbi:hypothetical protein [Dyadobacter diqingensis]|uniref:hypothetical protein n=1 Tax=Dyadobacter diqingensis TaxID=2938121 RepID=UPI0020C40DC4|nr:hypothetical protein [Dyadobacter diqingensis]